MSKYPFRDIEKKWQQYWETHKTFKVTEDPTVPKDRRAYVLDMFPYPSGAGLHVGHPEGYTATDIYCRYLRMKGYKVLHPMGFDSFGLPAENYAIKTGTHPEITTEQNIATFREQIKSLGFSYDWDREVSTHRAEYYKWTQWIFLKLYERGLAYMAETPVWYCPALGSVLANEEVLNTPEGPRSEIGRHPVERKPLRQWILKITAYADRLIDDLEALDWPESIKAMQRNWIGRSEGANVRFKLAPGYGSAGDTIEIFTTRPDTLFGASYMVVAPEHPIVEKITTHAQSVAVKAYADKAKLKSDLERTDLAKEKTGVFTGAYALNPVNGEQIPVWVSDYILFSYGTGAIMAVPAHDERDWEFAKLFKLPIRQVVSPEKPAADGSFKTVDECYSDNQNGWLVNSGRFNGTPVAESKRLVTEWLEAEKLGKKTINYKLRDWVFSRQRYWGEPIPLVHTGDGKIEPVSVDELPLTLPQVESYKPAGTGESPLAAVKQWLEITLPDGRSAIRETNTMPQWAGSCWYYLRYVDPHNTSAFASKEKIDYWMPVDLYVGGAEHAVLHLLYARFWHKVLYDMGLVTTVEPFQRLVNQGMITSFAFKRPDGSLVPTDEVSEVETDSFVEKKDGSKVDRVIAKMSKSLKNVINPDDVIRDYGADSMRLYEMFMGPLRMSKPWSTEGIVGIHRFLDRVWRLSERPLSSDEAPRDLLKVLHKTIQKVGDDTTNLDFNTAISQMMIMVNELYKYEILYRAVVEPFILVLAPYAPHLAEELWALLGHKESLAYESFPVFNPSLAADEEVTIALQINGKVRAEVKVKPNTTPAELEEIALDHERIKELSAGKKIVKIIAVPNKIVNIVVAG